MRAVLFLFILSYSAPVYAQDIYPLHIGDKWLYAGDGARNWNKRVTRDTVMPNGKTYFRIERMIDTARADFERVDGSQVFKYDTLLHDEYQLFDLSITEGRWHNAVPRGESDTADIWFQWSYLVYDRFLYTERRVWQYAVSLSRNSTDAVYAYEVKESFGVTHIYHGFLGIDAALRGAIINGYVYGDVTAVRDRSGELPGVTQLQQNYPNPFNGTTQISFTLASRKFVSVDIYNILGEHVATLVSEERNPGNHAIAWDTEGLPSGVYYYRLRAGDIAETKKLLLAN